ncbi:hypothetical protein GCM10027515_29850 [Schumannella luteola]|uniref:Uncharacterized protein n=1 Tax=Schumannella luteola TaxID=472059 RepID=A0A852YD60_9MICO|nr:hypothetical protein [Schumannella luteola]NYG99214.1 hypothetical protein [Schumannella luteola]TPX02523.1 hypothetical protein FJ656_21985 [Schumannella luteola]
MSSSSFDGSALSVTVLLDELLVRFPSVPRGRVEAMLVEEHEILLGGEPGDVVPQVLRDAVLERVEREAGIETGPDGDALPA